MAKRPNQRWNTAPKCPQGERIVSGARARRRGGERLEAGVACMATGGRAGDAGARSGVSGDGEASAGRGARGGRTR